MLAGALEGGMAASADLSFEGALLAHERRRQR